MWRLANLFLAFNLVLGCVYSQPLVKVDVDKDKVKTGETFTYTIRIEGNFNSPKIILPEFKGLKVVSQVQSRQYSFHHNRPDIKIIMKYKLVAYYPGKYKIDSVVVKDGRKRFASKTITIKAVGKPIEKPKEKKDILKGGITI